MEWNLFLAKYADVFFYLATMEALIIASLIIYLFFRRWDVDNDNKSKNKNKDVEYTSSLLNKKNAEVVYWRNAFLDADRELKVLKSSIDSQNDQKYKKRYVRISDESEHETPASEGYEAMLKKALESRNRVRETTNGDGTVKREIEFEITNDEPVSELIEEQAIVTFTPKYDYLETANSGQFRKLLPSDEKSLFRTWVENGVRKFEFHGNVDNALANFNAVFDDVCEIEGKQTGATQITNVEPGILSSQLKVEKKAIIKLT